MASGVPQGSVLGPILFVIYINTLPNTVENSSILLFADDAKVYKGVRNQEDRSDLQEDINRLLTSTYQYIDKIQRLESIFWRTQSCSKAVPKGT